MRSWFPLVLALATIATMNFVSQAVAADTIRLKNGNSLQGQVVRSDEREVTLEIPGAGTVTFNRDDIASIEQSPSDIPQEPPPMTPEFSHIETPPTPSTEPPEVVEKPSEPDVSMVSETTATPLEQSEQLEQATASKAEMKKQLLEGFKQGLRQRSRARELPAGMRRWLALLGLIEYVFFLLCLYLIAKKLGVSHRWMAWVPVLQLVVMCWVAGFSAWWLLGLAAAPFLYLYLGGLMKLSGVGLGLWFLVWMVLLPIAVFILWGARVSQARGKPWPWGLLLLLPYLGPPIFFGYLAFSDGAAAAPSKPATP